jgi:predicted nucleic acid-binding protein
MHTAPSSVPPSDADAAASGFIARRRTVGGSERANYQLIVTELCALLGVPLLQPALFLAGKAFLQYRRRGGTRAQVLPDFFIGAQAAVNGWALLTRDAARYRSCFPSLQLLAP